MEEDLEIAIKVVIVGNGAVGKSSMIQRYCKGIFTKDYKKTIGVDFLERELEYEGEEIRLMLWDTAGQEEFDAITKAYYRGAQACVLAFSSTDRASFEAVRNWKRKVEAEVGEIPTVLVQNKIDLMEQATVSEEETESLAKDLRLRLYKTSVKDNINVDTVFEHLVEKYLSDLQKQEEQSRQSSIGPSLLSAPGLAQTYNDRTTSSNFAQLSRTQNNTELVQIHRNSTNGNHSRSIKLGNGRALSSSSSSRKKEKCSLL